MISIFYLINDFIVLLQEISKCVNELFSQTYYEVLFSCCTRINRSTLSLIDTSPISWLIFFSSSTCVCVCVCVSVHFSVNSSTLLALQFRHSFLSLVFDIIMQLLIWDNLTENKMNSISSRWSSMYPIKLIDSKSFDIVREHIDWFSFDLNVVL